MDKLPFLSKDLIEQLDKIYPEQRPTPTEDIKSIMYYAGQRSVVTKLQYLLECIKEEENITERSLIK